MGDYIQRDHSQLILNEVNSTFHSAFSFYLFLFEKHRANQLINSLPFFKFLKLLSWVSLMLSSKMIWISLLFGPLCSPGVVLPTFVSIEWLIVNL